MVVTVFGLGFVGLTTALGFAHYGNKVYGIEIDDERRNTIKNGNIPFLEPGLKEALNNTLNKNLFITEDVASAINESEYVFYCVGTPYGENGEADLSYLFKAIEQTLPNIEDNNKVILITKSTIPPSTTSSKIVPFIESKGKILGKNLFVANNPEFLREGYCWEDFIKADRIVVGCDFEEGIKMMETLYKPFNIPFFGVSSNTGEFIKYLSNSLLATLISYSNEMAELADIFGNIEIAKAFDILHMDKRWNGGKMATYVYPGCGYGGYCLPKDTCALYSTAKNSGFEPKILGEVIKRNESMPEVIAKKIEKQFNKSDKIGILGLSFKPNSDDVRYSASAKIIKCLQKKGYNNFIAYDPVAIEEFKKYYNIDMEYCNTLQEILDKADKFIILTAWEEFRNIDTQKDIIDCRYMR
ncbi:MAG: UDP-glucose/GDP-mannose dehydrogenase family protein [Clostridiales bacterium]|nr:UDP-glucose/GDP-mannose dehydrogenase family protein [Clostridiales bacterium]